MNIEHIFELGHTISTIIGWAIFIIASIWIGPLLPHAYDAWVINRRNNPMTYSIKKFTKRKAAIERLTIYRDFIVKNSSLKSHSRSLSDFGKYTIIISIICIVLMIVGIFFPTILKVLIWIISVTM